MSDLTLLSGKKAPRRSTDLSYEPPVSGPTAVWNKVLQQWVPWSDPMNDQACFNALARNQVANRTSNDTDILITLPLTTESELTVINYCVSYDGVLIAM